VGHRASGLGAELEQDDVASGSIDGAAGQLDGAALDVRIGQVEDVGAQGGPLPRHRIAVLDGLGRREGRESSARVIGTPGGGGDQILVEELGAQDRLGVALGKVLAGLTAGVVPGVRVGAAGMRAALGKLALHVGEDLVADRKIDATVGGDALAPGLAQPSRDGLAPFLAPSHGRVKARHALAAFDDVTELVGQRLLHRADRVRRVETGELAGVAGVVLPVVDRRVEDVYDAAPIRAGVVLPDPEAVAVPVVVGSRAAEFETGPTGAEHARREPAQNLAQVEELGPTPDHVIGRTAVGIEAAGIVRQEHAELAFDFTLEPRVVPGLALAHPALRKVDRRYRAVHRWITWSVMTSVPGTVGRSGETLGPQSVSSSAARGKHVSGQLARASHSAPPSMLPEVTLPTAARPRQASIDFVRGLVMALMTLDHVRDFLGTSPINPRDVGDPALFVTRWITHFCAPTFVFLAGVSAYLFGHRGRSRRQISRFLLTRGLWLVVLELTIVRFAVTFHVTPDTLNLQVIWAIGWSMVALSALVFLPRWAIGAFGVVLIAGHNLLDGMHAAALGNAGWLWDLLHERAVVGAPLGITVHVSYPLIPWIGVLAAGYAFGPIFTRPAGERSRRLLQWGLGAVALFVVLRALDVYGDPTPRVAYADVTSFVLSFVNTEKYPPSLLYLGMTLGPALLLLAAAERARGPIARWLVTLGRVPMLYYVAHLFLAHLMAVAYASASHGDVGWLFRMLPTRNKPAGYGVGLPAVYAAWLAAVLALTPLCRWFAALKQRRSDWWLSYL